jgi:hypothetical protein
LAIGDSSVIWCQTHFAGKPCPARAKGICKKEFKDHERGNSMNRKHPVVYALLFAVLLSLSTASFAQISVGISFNVRIAPPALPVYEQPICPSPGYLWTPGYWSWNDDAGYYWVPGTWVEAPTPGLLWTPGYWGWNNGFYGWNEGYWGPHVGFYGGVNYGFGFGGSGFVGGEWRGGAFFYNTAVMHVDTVHITNVYVNRTVIVNNDSHVAFNGGEGGLTVRASVQEESYAREPHTPPVAAQVAHVQAASQNRANFASENHGSPAIAATARPGEFSGKGVVAAKAAGAPYKAPAMSPKEARGPAPAATSSAAARSNAARPFTPPAKNTEAAPMKAEAPREATPRTETARPQSESRPQTEGRPQTEARPQPKSQPKPEAKPKSSAKPKPAPKEEKEKK